VIDDKHQKEVDELIKHDRRITQKQTAGRLGMSKERVGYNPGEPTPLFGASSMPCRCYINTSINGSYRSTLPKP
jgi:hypothetical protein